MKSSLFIRLMTGIFLYGLAMVALPAAMAEAPAAGTNPDTATVENASLPLHRIVFYRNGVAYFERRGWVEGRAEVCLTFPADQVPDVLRSLLVLDLGQGRIGSVRHETAAEPAVGAGDLPVTLPAISRQEDLQGGLAGVLKQLQGATVAVARGQETVAGAVLNVEQRQRESADGKWITHHVVLMGADGTVR
ncbi:MAG: hypothetical protein JXQ27_05065, partial [Acidobacteria bacterium]|nr:hypothetical protein [Acidobacteriota bacterium]